MIIKETTAISLSVLAMIAGFVLWLTALYATVETSKADIKYLKAGQDKDIRLFREEIRKVNNHLRNINTRLSRIEGRLDAPSLGSSPNP